jgi:LPS sulfotransferase NodH
MDPSERLSDEPRKPTRIDRISDRRRRQITTVFPVEGRQQLPSFFIVGPPRTGTSWLHEVLRSHAVLPFPTKETRFFDTHFDRGLEWYLAHYPAGRNGSPIGEIAPTYFASGEARSRIAQIVPQARVVCIFREPLERLLSLYRVKRAYGLIPWSFEQAFRQDSEFIETSRYSVNLKAWQQTFGGQGLATVYDDLRDDPQMYLDQVVDFIGVPRFRLTHAQKSSVHASEKLTHPRNYNRTRNASRMADWLKAQRMDRLVAAVRNSPLRRLFLGGGRPFAEPSAELVLQLREFFLPEIETMESLLNRDLSAWKRGKTEPRAGAASAAL